VITRHLPAGTVKVRGAISRDAANPRGARKRHPASALFAGHDSFSAIVHGIDSKWVVKWATGDLCALEAGLFGVKTGLVIKGGLDWVWGRRWVMPMPDSPGWPVMTADVWLRGSTRPSCLTS